jgi:hypothetical protein
MGCESSHDYEKRQGSTPLLKIRSQKGKHCVYKRMEQGISMKTNLVVPGILGSILS